MKISYSKYLVHERTRRGWSQGDLAEKANTTRVTISKIESGSPVSPATISQIQKAFREHDPIIPDEIALPGFESCVATQSISLSHKTSNQEVLA